jgi:PAS domain S-box-containing protein
VVKFPDRARQIEEYDDPQEAQYVLENLLESSADSIGMVDAKGRFVRWNWASEEIFGYSAADLKEKHYSELYADPAELETMLTRLRRDGFVRKYAISMKKKDGSIAPFNLSINLLYDRQHNLTGSLCIARDRSDTLRALAELRMLNERLENEITDRKKMEDNLRETRETLRALLNAIPETIFLIGAGGVIVAANETAAERLGKGLDELIGSKMSELVPSEVFKSKKVYTDEAIRTGRAVHFEDMRDGRYLDNFICPIINAAGKVSKLAVFSMNITERKMAEEALRKAEEKYRSIFENAIEGIFQSTPEGIYIGANTAMAKMFGYESPEDLMANISSIKKQVYVDPQRRDEFIRLLEIDGFVKDFEYQVLRKDGSTIWISENARSVKNEKGKIYCYEGFMQDITERKRAGEATKENLRLRQQILDTIPNPIFYKSIDGRYQGVNQAFRQFYGKTIEQILGKTVHEVFSKELADKYFQADQDLFQHPGTQVFEFETYDVQGQRRHILSNKATFVDKGGALAGLAGIIFDITEQKKAEEERLRFSKLESLSSLAGGIAHDFNNILTAILGNINLAMLADKIEPQVRDRLAQAEQACLRAQALSRQLLTFAKGGAPIKRFVSIANLLIESSVLTLSGSKSRCKMEIPGDLWPVEADEAQINQVISNLLINADQAMPEGGIIKITAENISINAKSNLPISKGKYVKFAIADQGMGISPKYLDKIFDPYFSTKQKGSGLGLATAYSIIKNHSGHIQVESRMGVGTTFYIYLPAANKGVPADQPETVKPAMGQGKVLVMDDEEMVREVLGGMLSRLGYEVDFATDGSQAIEKFVKAKEANQPFAAVILDLTIPAGMGGKEAMKRLLKIDPQVKAIVSSGYSDDPIMADFQKYGFAGIIAKPYNVVELGKILNKALTGVR